VRLKDQLIQIGWKQIGGDSSLEKLISELRKALDPERLIVTSRPSPITDISSSHRSHARDPRSTLPRGRHAE
jgi:hypothetical protein